MSPISEITWNVQSGEKMDRGLMSQEVLCEFIWIYNRARPSNGKSQTFSVFHYTVCLICCLHRTLWRENKHRRVVTNRSSNKNFSNQSKTFSKDSNDVHFTLRMGDIIKVLLSLTFNNRFNPMALCYISCFSDKGDLQKCFKSTF